MSEHTSHGHDGGHDAGHDGGHSSGRDGGVTDERQHFWDNPRNVKVIFNVFYACCAILVALEFFIHEHDVHSWEGLVSFYPLYGFVGIVVLVQIAKVMRRLLMRPEDYYERGD